ncbi:hypothetical protein ABZ897_60285 [Nonomuraea sp. NPDC046802]|uniref:DUF6927 domain-containing protein n=1 Tax=Nonomuraea sp. NPDC046802 TaxID=3154919 RepID=UPI0033C0BE60
MGSTSTHREPGMSDREFLENQLPNTLTKQGQILAGVTVRGVFYAAVRDKRSSKVWALVVLIKRSRGYFNCTYKEMDERDGPVEDHCPVRIIELLSPLPACSHDQEYCQLCNAEITPDDGQWLSRALPRRRPEVAGPRCSVRPGTCVRFARPLQFSNGEQRDTFIFVTRSTFRAPDGNLRYRIPRWRTDRDFEVVSPPLA